MDEPHTAVSERAVTAVERPRRVVVGVAGSIAAYKAPSVIRLLRREGHEVRTVATEAALRFIGAPALAAVTGRPVSTGVFDDPAAVEHVEMGGMGRARRRSAGVRGPAGPSGGRPGR